MSLEGKVQYSCPVPIFLIELYWKFLVHTKIAYELRVFHDFVQSTFGQVQGH